MIFLCSSHTPMAISSWQCGLKLTPKPSSQPPDMSLRSNSLKEVIQESNEGVMKGDTRTIDYGSYDTSQGFHDPRIHAMCDQTTLKVPHPQIPKP